MDTTEFDGLNVEEVSTLDVVCISECSHSISQVYNQAEVVVTRHIDSLLEAQRPSRTEEALRYT